MKNFILNVAQKMLISTPLQLAYLKGNKMSFLNGLDLNRREELWGIRLTNGVCLSLYDYQKNWYQSMKEAGRLRHGLCFGYLPTKGYLRRTMSTSEGLRYDLTQQILRDNGIYALNYQADIFCRNELGVTDAYFYNPRFMTVDWDYKSRNARLAVIF